MLVRESKTFSSVVKECSSETQTSRSLTRNVQLTSFSSRYETKRQKFRLFCTRRASMTLQPRPKLASSDSKFKKSSCNSRLQAMRLSKSYNSKQQVQRAAI